MSTLNLWVGIGFFALWIVVSVVVAVGVGQAIHLGTRRDRG